MKVLVVDKFPANRVEEMKAAVEYDPNNYLYYYNLGKIQYMRDSRLG